jgi:hypothetical protein
MVTFAAGDERPEGVGGIDVGAADELGVGDMTLFVLRPDGYVGLRADRDHLASLARYDDLLRAGV